MQRYHYHAKLLVHFKREDIFLDETALMYCGRNIFQENLIYAIDLLTL